jgi:hypothetical protein
MPYVHVYRYNYNEITCIKYITDAMIANRRTEGSQTIKTFMEFLKIQQQKSHHHPPPKLMLMCNYMLKQIK